MTVITVPEPLRDRLGPDATKALVDLLNQTTGKIRDDLVLVLDHRFELFEEKFERRLAEEIAGLRDELTGRITELRDELTGQITELREELTGQITELREEHTGRITGLRDELSGRIAGVEKKVAGLKGELVAWMFVFWVTQLGAILGVLFGFFRP